MRAIFRGKAGRIVPDEPPSALRARLNEDNSPHPFRGALPAEATRKKPERSYVRDVMIRLKFFLRLATVVLALACVAPAGATRMIPLSIEELAERSQAVVQGTVAGRTVVKDEAGRLVTRIRLNVAEVWKGTVARGNLTLVQAGGVLGRRQTEIVGAPRFAMGEEVAAFLVFNARGEAVVLGLSQGKFEILTGADGAKQARNPFHGGAVGGDGNARALQNRLGNRPLSLADLKRRVRAAAK